jgi:transposase-like protein
MSEPAEDSVQRWTAKRRAALIVSILKGETSIPAAARKHGITVADVEEWHQRFLLGVENALRTRPKEEALKEEQIKKLKQKIGELVLDNDILREALKPYPLAHGTSDE